MANTPVTAAELLDMVKDDLKKHKGSGVVPLPTAVGGGGAASEILKRAEELRSQPEYAEAPPEPTDRTPWGSEVGGVAGPLGASFGEAVQQLTEHATGSPFAPQSSAEAAKRIALEGGSNLLLGKVGSLAGGQVKRLLRQEATPEAAEGIVFARSGMRHGGQPTLPEGSPLATLPLTPPEETQSRGLQILENMAEGSFTGGSAIQLYRQKRQHFVEEGLQNFFGQVGAKTTPAELGEIVVGAAKGNRAAFRAPLKQVYNDIADAAAPKPIKVMEQEVTSVIGPMGKPLVRQVEKTRLAGGAKIDLRPLKKFAEPLNDMSKSLRGIGGDLGGDEAVAKIASMPDFVDYRTAQVLRSRLLAMGDVFRVDNKKAPAIRVYDEAMGAVDKAMDDGLGRFSPELRDLWRQTNSAYKGVEEKYNNELIRQLFQVADHKRGGIPDNVFQQIWKRGEETTIKRVRDAVGDGVWPKIQRRALEVMTQAATHDGYIVGRSLEAEMRKMGPEVIKATFSPEQKLYLDRWINLVKVMQGKSVDETGKMLIQLTQGGVALRAASELGESGLFGAMGSQAVNQAGLILGGPWVISRIFTNPDLAKHFIDGMTTPSNSSKAGEIIGRILNGLYPRPDFREKPPVRVSKGVAGLPDLPPPAGRVPFTPSTEDELAEKVRRQQTRMPVQP